VSAVATDAGREPLAIEELARREHVSGDDVDAFLAEHEVPIIEGERATFLFRGHADEVHVRHRIVELPDRLPMERVEGTDLWFRVLELPHGSRVEYRLEVAVDGEHHEFDDPLNPRRAPNPFGANAVCYGAGYETPDWTHHDPDARPGRLEEIQVTSAAFGEVRPVTLYLPARFRSTARYPLLVVHDGGDYLRYAAMQTVLDNLIHRLDVAEMVVAFLHPGDRLAEYPDDPAHAAFVTDDLVPDLEQRLPLVGHRTARCLLGSSFGAIAALSVAARAPDVYGSVVLQSGSFVFTDIHAADHGGGEVFDPVVRFVNRYRSDPQRVADRVYVSCGTYEPLIVRNRAMVPTFRSTGMEVRFDEARDGHNWENWRDRLRDALSWVYPGPQRLYYE
jgi:enterochelin esterase-like enzyme